MRGNFNGLNLTDIKITLAGEISLHEFAIQEKLEQRKKENLQDLYDKVNWLKEIQKKVCERISLDEQMAGTRVPTKMGAKLKKGDELEEWLERQE